MNKIKAPIADDTGISRFLQGVGTQGTNSAGVAIILETSDDFQKDMAFQELMVGSAYMAGPFVGGWMYKYFGECPPSPSQCHSLY